MRSTGIILAIGVAAVGVGAVAVGNASDTDDVPVARAAVLSSTPEFEYPLSVPLADVAPRGKVLNVRATAWKLLGTTDGGHALVLEIFPPAGRWCGGADVELEQTPDAVTVQALAKATRCPAQDDLLAPRIQPVKVSLKKPLDGRFVGGPRMSTPDNYRLPRNGARYIVPGVLGLSPRQASQLWGGLSPQFTGPADGFVAEQEPRSWILVDKQDLPPFKATLETPNK